MRFTEYGNKRSETEKSAIQKIVHESADGARAFALGGASLHAYCTGIDVGERYVLTGRDAYGRQMRREAGSILAAYSIMRAAWGYSRVWHVREDGRRRLAIIR